MEGCGKFCAHLLQSICCLTRCRQPTSSEHDVLKVCDDSLAVSILKLTQYYHIYSKKGKRYTDSSTCINIILIFQTDRFGKSILNGDSQLTYVGQHLWMLAIYLHRFNRFSSSSVADQSGWHSAAKICRLVL